MQFQVRALDAQQNVRQLLLEAADEADARTQTAARELVPLSVASVGAAALRRRSGFALLLFAQELHALLSAGLSVIESLDVLIEKESAGDRRAVLARVSAQLRQGMRLSAALQQQPDIFPAVLVGVVHAAEGTSSLPQALQRYIDYESRVDAVRHKVVSAAIYPSILLGVGGAVALFLLGYVVPRFASVYQGSGRPLPWASELLMGWGQFIHAHAMPIASAMVILVAFGVGWTRKHLGAGGLWRMLALLPGARPRIEILELSRLYLTLGMLLEGGIALHQALHMARAVLPAARQPALEAARRGIESGQSLSQVLEASRLGTPVALRLLRVGEKSGQLGPMLTRAAAFYDSETTRWIERFTKTFEPLLMAAIGVVIGLIVILLYMPVFDLAGSLP